MKMLWLTLLAIACCGCAVVRVSKNTKGDWSVFAGSLFKTINIPHVSASNGCIRVDGYQGGVDGESFGAAVGTAGKALLK